MVKKTGRVLSLDNRTEDWGVVDTGEVAGLDISREDIIMEKAKQG